MELTDQQTNITFDGQDFKHNPKEKKMDSSDGRKIPSLAAPKGSCDTHIHFYNATFPSAGNVNRKLTICDNRILTTPERCLKFEMTRVNHLTPSLSGRA